MWHLGRSVLALRVFEKRLGFCSVHQVIGGHASDDMKCCVGVQIRVCEFGVL